MNSTAWIIVLPFKRDERFESLYGPIGFRIRMLWSWHETLNSRLKVTWIIQVTSRFLLFGKYDQLNMQNKSEKLGQLVLAFLRLLRRKAW